MKKLPEETMQYVQSLVSEFRDIVTNLSNIRKLSKAERMMIGNRLKEIKQELLTIKEQYKDD